MALKTANLDLYIYSGTSTSYTSNDLKYQLQKSIVGTNTKILFEISELVSDYITHNFNDDYNSVSIWVTTITTLFDETDTIFTYGSPVVETFLAVDGYGYFEDGINTQLSNNALITTNTIYLPEDTTGKLPIYAEGVGKVSIDLVDTEITDNDNTNQKIQYIDIPANSSTVQVYGTDDTTLLRTIRVNNVCEPKYKPYKVTFVNRLGAYQDIYFFKKSLKRIDITDERFKRNTVVNNSVSYGLNAGQEQRYNTNATQSITLNTGFIS